MFAGCKTLLFIVICSISALSHAEIYKWVDKEGNTHYSDKPPKDKTIKAEQQNLDNMNIVEMPRPIQLQSLSATECQQAVDNFSQSYSKHKALIEKDLAKGVIDDMQFAERLTQLEGLKRQITVKNCAKADPKLNTLLHCMANNRNTVVCD